MQIDFHHTAIYVLCRLAGMKSVHAEKVAYASQHVDDAVMTMPLNLLMEVSFTRPGPPIISWP